MASYTNVTTKHATLTGTTVDTLTLAAPKYAVTVSNGHATEIPLSHVRAIRRDRRAHGGEKDGWRSRWLLQSLGYRPAAPFLAVMLSLRRARVAASPRGTHRAGPRSIGCQSRSRAPVADGSSERWTYNMGSHLSS